ncbi:hypothetical protein [Streptomyces sp. NBC_01334]|uniref:hypothetical protein n=1 Tax=Streptomyces sp. NBC_01334 TaxID=2903827 RepID=UPI002E13875D|nr:hypothetical protein OG736_02305 [Streptomyces sp. NBC_01334]
MDEAVAAGTATTPAHPSRGAIFDAVRADRTGPVAVRLLRLAHADDPFVRRNVMDLLHSLAPDGPWPGAAEVALARLCDVDEQVRRRAARLLVRAGREDVALNALDELTDPVVRTVLADSLGGSVAHLRADPLASVRFLTHLETLRAAPRHQWPALDMALLADAREAARHLEGVGRRWGSVLFGLDRERHTYVLAARLLAASSTSDIGAGLAREACHGWRAAAVELLPLLVRHCGRVVSPATAAALTTASISEAAMRTHGALAATVPFTPYPRVRRSSGSPPPSFGSSSAAALLAARPVGIGRLAHAPEIFGALLDAGPLTFRQAAQLYNLTFRWPGRMQAGCAPLWLRHAGPTALPRLLALMTPHLGEYTVGEYYLEGLARMGRHALPALPAVTALIDRRTRIPVNDSTQDAEMMLDERLLAAALDARRAIDGDTAPRPPAQPSDPGDTHPAVTDVE